MIVPRIKSPIQQKLFGAANNLGLDPFLTPSAILTPLAAILDFGGGSMFIMEGVLGSNNLFSKSCLEGSKT